MDPFKILLNLYNYFMDHPSDIRAYGHLSEKTVKKPGLTGIYLGSSLKKLDIGFFIKFHCRVFT
jgi:hypothetical protein